MCRRSRHIIIVAERHILSPTKNIVAGDNNMIYICRLSRYILSAVVRAHTHTRTHTQKFRDDDDDEDNIMMIIINFRSKCRKKQASSS